MNPNKPICGVCARRAKKQGYLVHHLPPYLKEKRNIIKCHLCKKRKYHDMYLNTEFENHPRKVWVTE